MSTKTYAGFRSVRQYGVQHSMSGYDGYSLCPTDDDDDRIFRSRLGYPWSGSGPWCTIERVIDVNNPSTDGCFDISIGQASGVAIEIWVADGFDSYNARYTYTRSGGKTYLRLQYSETRNIIGKIVGNYRVLVTRDRFSVLTKFVPEEEFPFSRSWLSQIYAQPHDWSRALYAARMGGQYARTGPIDTTYYEDGYRETVNVRFDRYFNLDLTPPVSLFQDVLDSADLYLATGILPGQWAMGWETAYVEACKSLPQAATNVAANVLEVASLLTSFLTGDILGELPKNARDAWLTYRYVYTTTKLDIREFRSTFSRLESVLQSNTVAVYGSYTRGDVDYRVGFDIDTAQILPTDVSTTLRRFGLELNALNAWDMIPYSFVVDWFLPISGIIEYFQDLSACKYEPQDLWFSLVTTREGYRCFVRLPGRKLSTLPYLQLSEVGGRTIAMRIADAVALFTP